MLELVAEKHGLGAGTVEKLYRDFLMSYPDQRTKRRKTSTIQVDKKPL